MRVHHLNCGTLCPASARLINGRGGLLSAGQLICHCLLIETNDGLVLVDTGLGLKDVAMPRHRLGRLFLTNVRPKLDPAETAARQVERLGFKRADVRHIVLTHLDLDHAGGLTDFPDATVHVLSDEHSAAMQRATLNEKKRYVPDQWAHNPNWRLHVAKDIQGRNKHADGAQGDGWMGFESVQVLGDEVGTDVLLVPLFGHTRGHCGVAIKAGDGWLLHCGDAYFFRDEMAESPHCTPGLRVFQRLVAVDNSARMANQRRLRELKRDHHEEVRLFCSHDVVELEAAQGS